MEKKGAKRVAQAKLAEVEKLVGLIGKHPTIAIADITSLPAAQLHKIKKKLRGKASVLVSKKRLIKIALEQAEKQAGKQGSLKLVACLKGMPALVFSELNPFELYSLIKQNRTKAAAKPGQVAPVDAIAPAGPTPFAPGPVISQLGKLGIKAAIEAGKVVIKQDCVVVKAGTAFSSDASSILARLGVEPMEIGVNVVAALEKGEVYERAVLDVDVDAFINSIKTAYSDSMKLALGLGIPTRETISLLITKAESEAKALAVKAKVLNKESAAAILSQAEATASVLQETVIKGG